MENFNFLLLLNYCRYFIGDCGGAMVRSRCPECQETIGGAQHQLHAGNQFMPEMDGAAGPAWPGMDRAVPAQAVHEEGNVHLEEHKVCICYF